MIMPCLQINENNCRSWLLSEFTQTQIRYTTLLDKISTLKRKLLVISSQNFSCELNSSRTYSLQKTSYLPLRLYYQVSETVPLKMTQSWSWDSRKAVAKKKTYNSRLHLKNTVYTLWLEGWGFHTNPFCLFLKKFSDDLYSEASIIQLV